MNKATALSEAIDLTDQILILLEQEDFDAVSELDSRRLPLIEAAFAGSIEEVDRIKALHLKNLNDQAVSKLLEMKALVIGSHKKIRHAVKAARAYSDNQY